MMRMHLAKKEGASFKIPGRYKLNTGITKSTKHILLMCSW